MTDDMFEIGAEGVDTDKIIAEIREACLKRAEGDDKAEGDGPDPFELAKKGILIEGYLDSLRDAVYVDITDFEIEERRAAFRGPLTFFKRIIWNCMKFYTYRLWSQQNEVNGLLLSSIEAYSDRVSELEARIDDLEKR